MKKLQEAIDYMHNLAIMLFLAVAILICSLLTAVFNRRTLVWVTIVLLFAGMMIGWLWICSRVRFG